MNDKRSWIVKAGVFSSLAAWAIGVSVSVLSHRATVRYNQEASVSTPSTNREIARECVHEVAAGASVNLSEIKPNSEQCAKSSTWLDADLLHIPASSHSWIENSFMSPGSTLAPGNFYPNEGGYAWIKELQVSFVTPPVPTDPSVGVALFPAFQSGYNIIQPVLAWGVWTCAPSAVAGYWQLANEFVTTPTDGGATTVVCNNVGQVAGGVFVTAQIYVDPSKPCENDGLNCTWIISESVRDAAIGQSYLEVSTGPLNWIAISSMCFEQYGFTSCSQMPGGDGYHWTVNTTEMYQAGYPWTQSFALNFDSTNLSGSYYQWIWELHLWDGPDCGFGITTYPDSGAVTLLW